MYPKHQKKFNNTSDLWNESFISLVRFFGSILLTVGDIFTDRYFCFKYKNSTNISIIVSDETNKLRRDYAPMQTFISNASNIKDKNICFQENVEKKEYKGSHSLFYDGELSYHPKIAMVFLNC